MWRKILNNGLIYEQNQCVVDSTTIYSCIRIFFDVVFQINIDYLYSQDNKISA